MKKNEEKGNEMIGNEPREIEEKRCSHKCNKNRKLEKERLIGRNWLETKNDK